jgi:hypothetical protein
MDFYESDLEDIIHGCLKTRDGVYSLAEKGLDVDLPIATHRQLKIGAYGVSDIVTISKNNEEDFTGNLYPYVDVTIYELKRGVLNLDSLIQLFGYIKGVNHYCKERGFDSSKYNIKGVLVGRTLNTESWVYLMDYIDCTVDVYTYDYTIDGMRFNLETFGYKLSDPKFKIEYK